MTDTEDVKKNPPKKQKNKSCPLKCTNRKKHRKRLAVCVLLFICLICILKVTATYLNSAYLVISMDFPAITDGRNPDGSPFDLYEIINDKIMTRVCRRLDNKIDVELLKKHISITGNTSPGSFDQIYAKVLDSDQDYSYFPSRYTITYSVVSDIIRREDRKSQIKAFLHQFSLPDKREILKVLGEECQKYYDETYVDASKILTPDWSLARKYDYYYLVGEMHRITDSMARYIGKRYDENINFVSEKGIGYGDLSANLNLIVNNDIEKYRAFITEHGISVNKEILISQLTHLSDIYEEKHLKAEAEYESCLEGIKLYDPNVTKVAFIPALDTNNKFYMNRTQTGIDYLTQQAERSKHASNEFLTEKENMDNLAEKFKNSPTPTEEMFNRAEEQAKEIVERINEFSESALALDREYIKGTSYEGIVLNGIGTGMGIQTYIIIFLKTFIALLAFAYILYSLVVIMCKIFKRIFAKGGDN